jgi:hypothetical protein
MAVPIKIASPKNAVFGSLRRLRRRDWDYKE